MGKREELKARRRKEQVRNRLVPILIGVAVIVVLGILILPNILPKPTAARAITKDNTMGDPNAPVKVVEYADFQCPACGSYFATTESDVIQKYVNTGLVYYVYSPFSFIGPESVSAAQAAYCANDQGKFWDYHDILFQHQAGENQGGFANSTLIGFAKTLGLDSTAFTTCLTSEKYKAKVQADLAAGQDAGIKSTPTFIVDGQSHFADSLIATIDAELKAKGK